MAVHRREGTVHHGNENTKVEDQTIPEDFPVFRVGSSPLRMIEVDTNGKVDTARGNSKSSGCHNLVVGDDLAHTHYNLFVRNSHHDDVTDGAEEDEVVGTGPPYGKMEVGRRLGKIDGDTRHWCLLSPQAIPASAIFHSNDLDAH